MAPECPIKRRNVAEGSTNSNNVNELRIALSVHQIVPCGILNIRINNGRQDSEVRR